MNSAKFWAVFAVGVAAGAAVALIYAPQSGARTRRQLKRSFDDAGDYVKDATETLGDHADRFVKQGKEVVKQGRDVVDDLVSSAQTAAQSAVKQASKLV